MFKKAYKLLLLIVISALFMICFRTNIRENGITNNNEKVVKEDVFIIKYNDGTVYLFKNGITIKEYDIDIRLLPGSDIKRLTEGIKADTESDADRLVEDYDG